MAKASTGRAMPVKGKAAVTATARKKAVAVVAPKKKAAAAKKAAPVRKAAVAAKKAAAPVRKAKVAQRKAGRGPAPAAKKAAPRRNRARAVAPAAARRPAVPAKVKVKVKAGAGVVRGNPRQVFTVSHLNQDDFKVDGLRAYARYRDLGIAAATGGYCQAHVIRFTPPCTDEVRKRHLHRTELQLVYVLQGWMKNEFEGHGEQMMSAGSCWLQPSGIKHTVLDYSADCEVLEIIVPADFRTEELV